MVVITRRFDPAQPNVTPTASLSLVRWSDLVAAADQVRAYRGKVNVIARTRAKVRRFDPVDLALEVAPVR
jgi:hypothetical protein